MNALIQEWTEPQPVKLRVSDFELLDKSGAFDCYSKVELIEGTIVAMNAEYRLHGVVKNRIARFLQRALEQMGSELEALNEIAIRLGEESLPQPDAMIARITLDRRYFDVADVVLAVEVVDRSSRFDLKRKQALYARYGVPELWVADLRTELLNQFSVPRDGTYQVKHSIPLLGELRSLTMPELMIDGTHLL